MLSEHAQHAVLPATSAPPSQKFHDLVELNTNHELATAMNVMDSAAVARMYTAKQRWTALHD